MTTDCRPPDGTEPNTQHWLEHDKHGICLARYEVDYGVDQQMMWRISIGYGQLVLFSCRSTELGWRYLAPARPDDAVERARLEEEKKRLLDILRRVMAHGVAGCKAWHAIRAYDVGQEILAELDAADE